MNADPEPQRPSPTRPPFRLLTRDDRKPAMEPKPVPEQAEAGSTSCNRDTTLGNSSHGENRKNLAELTGTSQKRRAGIAKAGVMAG